MAITTFKLVQRDPSIKVWELEDRPLNGALHFRSGELKGYDQTFYKVEKSVAYEGCVVATGVDTGVRIMSDVWTDIEYAIVWDGNTYTKVRGQDLGAPYCSLKVIEVDADAERMEHYALWQEGTQLGIRMARLQGDYDRHQQHLKTERERVCKGRRVEVYKGRKVPVGTKGLVFWAREGNYGLNVGIATTERKDAQGRWADVVWTYGHNCRVIF